MRSPFDGCVGAASRAAFPMSALAAAGVERIGMRRALGHGRCTEAVDFAQVSRWGPPSSRVAGRRAKPVRDDAEMSFGSQTSGIPAALRRFARSKGQCIDDDNCSTM